MNNVRLIELLKEEAEELIVDYMQDNEEWRTDTNLDTYKDTMIDALFNEREFFRQLSDVEAYIEDYDYLEGASVESILAEIRDYVAAKEEENYNDRSETALDIFNQCFRFVSAYFVWDCWDSLVEKVTRRTNN